MDYTLHSHRFAKEIFESNDKLKLQLQDIEYVLSNITDNAIIDKFNSDQASNKSISKVINEFIKEGLEEKGWDSESPLFHNNEYNKGSWRLDFAKEEVSIEVAFNHSTVISWNLLKPTLAGELNHVEKAIQTSIGVIICATKELKKNGNFDNAIGTYEHFLEFLPPLYNKITVPILIIGITGFKGHTFKKISNKQYQIIKNTKD